MRNKYQILVSEPWDFTSPSGENIIIGSIIRMIDDKNLIYKADYIIEFSGLKGDLLMLTPRSDHGTFVDGVNNVSVNGSLIYLGESNTTHASVTEAQFVLIGDIREVGNHLVSRM